MLLICLKIPVRVLLYMYTCLSSMHTSIHLLVLASAYLLHEHVHAFATVCNVAHLYFAQLFGCFL